MRPYLTIALLLVASIGAQAAEPATGNAVRVAPGLLSALMEQPAGILAASQLSGSPGSHLLLGTFTAAGTAICCEGGQDLPRMLPANRTAAAAATPGPNPALASRSPRAP